MKRTICFLTTPLLFAAAAAAQSDDCANAPDITGLSPVAWDTNVASDTLTFATTSAEQQCISLSDDIWFRVTASLTGTLTASTCNAASMDTELGVWELGPCTSAAAISLGCNDDFAGCAGLTSEVTVPVTAGTEYFVQLGHWNSTVGDGYGSGTLTITEAPAPTPPTNDDCASPLPLALGANAVSNQLATPSGVLATVGTPYFDNTTPDTDCQDFGNGFDNLNLDVWYEFTPANAGVFLFSTCNMASFDTKVAAYSGTCAAPTALACNDDGDGCVGFSSELRATLSGGSTYLIQLGGFGAASEGSASLDVSLEGGPPALGTNVCVTSPNSNGSGAIMSASGSASASANDLTLIATGASAGQPGIFYYGPNALAGIAFGEGFRCAGGIVVRILPPVVSDGTGTLTKLVDNTVPAIATSASPIVDGSTYTFQCWYRDPACTGATSLIPGDCNDDGIGSGFNLSDGYTITFGP